MESSQKIVNNVKILIAFFSKTIEELNITSVSCDTYDKSTAIPYLKNCRSIVKIKRKRFDIQVFRLRNS